MACRNRDFIEMFHKRWLRPVGWTVAPRPGYWTGIVIYAKQSGLREHLPDSCRLPTESAAAEHASSLLKQAQDYAKAGRLE